MLLHMYIKKIYILHLKYNLQRKNYSAPKYWLKEAPAASWCMLFQTKPNETPSFACDLNFHKWSERYETLPKWETKERSVK